MVGTKCVCVSGRGLILCQRYIYGNSEIGMNVVQYLFIKLMHTKIRICILLLGIIRYE